ncbi:hypothetical protein RND81_08G158200 [Saponaria officinalis]|uniref:Uncharacterized protein n=1 Tax=Saponaria officinalis TaxID=3572 RepID=A0AAW1J832_SAPOF
MERVREYLCFKTSSSLLFPTTRIFTKLPSRLWLKAKGYATFRTKQATNKKKLVSLYKDKELCEGYGDIEIMWKMIHSTYSKDVPRKLNGKTPCFSIFCFKPN